jgi:tripartite-type tricarboxylate transporter receptor subunit TctC
MARSRVLAVFVAAMFATAPGQGRDNFPNTPMKIVLRPPGSALDVATRAIADELIPAGTSKYWSRRGRVLAI